MLVINQRIKKKLFRTAFHPPPKKKKNNEKIGPLGTIFRGKLKFDHLHFDLHNIRPTQHLANVELFAFVRVVLLARQV